MVPLLMTTRACRNCGSTPGESGFYVRTSGQVDSFCKECRRVETKRRYREVPGVAEQTRSTSAAWRKANPEKRKEYGRRDYFSQRGITEEWYQAKMDGQLGLCGACSAPIEVRPQLDHDHSCCARSPSDAPLCGGCWRDILCLQCNTALGMVSDSPDRLRKLIVYLERFGKREIGQ